MCALYTAFLISKAYSTSLCSEAQSLSLDACFGDCALRFVLPYTFLLRTLASTSYSLVLAGASPPPTTLSLLPAPLLSELSSRVRLTLHRLGSLAGIMFIAGLVSHWQANRLRSLSQAPPEKGHVRSRPGFVSRKMCYRAATVNEQTCK